MRFFKGSKSMIRGSIVALVTPMHADGEIDWDSLNQLIEWHLNEGTHGIVSVGTSGESPTLSVREHLSVIEHTVKQVDGRVPVIAGTGANSTREAIELTESARLMGADASLQVVPYYNKPTQEGLLRHFETIANSCDIPIILYNVPARTVADLLPPTVERLSHVDNIIGIKEATGDLVRAKEVIDLCPAEFAVYSGDDPTAAELILMGGRGDISVTANVAPRRMSELCEAALALDVEKARTLDQDIQPLHRALFIEPNPIPVKWALAEMGLIEHGIRLPLTPLSGDAQREVLAALKNLGLVS